MGFIGHPDLDQVTGSQVLRQRHRIAAVVLDLVAGSLGDQRGRHDVAFETLGGQIAMKAVAADPVRIAFRAELLRPATPREATWSFILVPPAASGFLALKETE